jgi:hypothetical protein
MRYSFCVVTVLLCLVAAPAFARDGSVPKSTLVRLGLAGMQTVSDQEGMQVRGMSGAARTLGRSLVNGLLISPDTKSFVFGSDVNSVAAEGERAGCGIIKVGHVHSSGVQLDLQVATEAGVFNGTLIGGAGGHGFAWAK